MKINNILSILVLTVIFEFCLSTCYDSLEKKELVTKGRLTITGLNAYEGQKISVISRIYGNKDGYFRSYIYLAACERLEVLYIGGKPSSNENFPINGLIVSGQANLKVYKGGGYYYAYIDGYDGNDQKIYFDIYLTRDNVYYNENEEDRIGYVIVDFTNGVGTGVFKQGNIAREGLYISYFLHEKEDFYDEVPYNLFDIAGTNIIEKAFKYINDNSDLLYEDNSGLFGGLEKEFTLVLDSNVNIAGNANLTLNSPVKLRIISFNDECKIKLTSAGSIFTVDGGTLTLNNITLTGINSNNSPVVKVNKGEFNMYNSTISSNTNSGNGGGVYVNDGSFYMRDGSTISGNTNSGNGGGVYVNDGSFYMRDGSTISGNTSSGNGGGVYVNDGDFYMYDGSIYGSNETNQTLRNNALNGAAVYIAPGGYANITPTQQYYNNTITK